MSVRMTIERFASTTGRVPVRQATAFLTYSREDAASRDSIIQSLGERGVELVGDWQLPPGPPYDPRLQQLIEEADALVFLMTPKSVISSPCRAELAHAELHKKRIVPLLVSDGFDEKTLPKSLAAPQWAYCRTPEETENAADGVAETINTDWDLAEDHAWLIKRAAEWRLSRGALLRGESLKRAEAWLPRVEANPLRLPNTTPEINSFIEVSRRARTHRQIAFLVALLVIAVAVPTAVRFRDRARNAERNAEARRQLTAAQALEQKGPLELEAAVALALEAQQKLPTVEGHAFLREKGSLLPRLIRTIELPSPGSFAFNADGTRYVTAGLDLPIEIRETRTHRVIRSISPPRGVMLYPIAFGSDSQTLWAFGHDGWLRRWRAEGGEEKRFQVELGGDHTAVLSSDARYLIASEGESCCTLFDTDTGARLPFEPPMDDASQRVTFSSDGRMVTIREGRSEYFVIRNVITGERRRVHVSLNDQDVVLSANGAHALALAEGGRVVNLVTGSALPNVELYADDKLQLAISPSGRAFAAIDEGMLLVWTMEGRQLVRRVLPELERSAFGSAV
ncbi:MAG TPA: toll/interleukin-1 receptor domain-containing protein, partial [Thermoanaerobaculia bacterium]|nr:toll/interleukin-1 receptor domain-containing protein [Thermoanaerobaculia bacterium]